METRALQRSRERVSGNMDWEVAEGRSGETDEDRRRNQLQSMQPDSYWPAPKPSWDKGRDEEIDDIFSQQFMALIVIVSKPIFMMIKHLIWWVHVDENEKLTAMTVTTPGPGCPPALHHKSSPSLHCCQHYLVMMPMTKISPKLTHDCLKMTTIVMLIAPMIILS